MLRVFYCGSLFLCQIVDLVIGKRYSTEKKKHWKQYGLNRGIKLKSVSIDANEGLYTNRVGVIRLSNLVLRARWWNQSELHTLHTFNPHRSHQRWVISVFELDCAPVAYSDIYSCYFELKPGIEVKITHDILHKPPARIFLIIVTIF